MSVFLSAPWDLIQATIQLPSPQLGNVENIQSKVNVRNAMDGELYSYVKSTDRTLKVWEFLLTRAKSAELEFFVEYYSHLELRVFDWDDNVFRMFIRNNPLDFTRISKGELTNVRLELEGFQIA